MGSRGRGIERGTNNLKRATPMIVLYPPRTPQNAKNVNFTATCGGGGREDASDRS